MKKIEKIVRILTKIGSLLSSSVFFLALLVEMGYLSEAVNFLLSSTDLVGNISDKNIIFILGLIGSVITLYWETTSDKSIPLNWILLMALSIWIIVFGCLIGGILVFLASILGLVAIGPTYLERLKKTKNILSKKPH